MNRNTEVREMDIYTLQDFITHTKAQEYLMGIASAIGFGLFWLALNREPKRGKSKES
jgi:hypothetical protein